MTDGPRVAVISGDGVVLRVGSTVVVIGASANAVSPELVDEVTETITKHTGDEQWRRLARLILEGDDPPPLAVATLEGESAAVFLYGDVEMSSPSDQASGTDHVLGVTREVAVPDGFRITAGRGGGTDIAPWSNLEAGAVRGAGIAVAVDADDTADLPRHAERPGEDMAGDSAEPDDSDDGADEVADVVAPFESISLRVADVDLSARDPLPIDAGAGATESGEPVPDAPVDAGVEAGPAYERPVMVMGVYSPRGFFNHPDAKYCSRTGVKMGASHTRVLVEGPRPPLGVLTLDDGSTHTVQWNLVIGRGPAKDARVKQDEAGPLVVVDDQQSVSRAHALLELVGWDVLVSDLGSRNHTFVQDGPNAPRRQLAVGERAALRSGTIVHLGERSFVYHEHHVR